MRRDVEDSEREGANEGKQDKSQGKGKREIWDRGLLKDFKGETKINTFEK